MSEEESALTNLDPTNDANRPNSNRPVRSKNLTVADNKGYLEKSEDDVKTV
jgi:hypothetical protein